jgi:REP-associated tyrosine transposase
MPRTARDSAGGFCYRDINRRNCRRQVYHKEGDYAAFVGLIAEACLRLPMRVLAFCLMPNRLYLALWPYADGDLSGWMQWLLTTHVSRYHSHYHSNGHV